MRRSAVISVLIAIFVCTFSVTVYAEGQSTKITQEDMIYFIMTDRFNDGDTLNDQGTNKGDMSAYHGGDFQGIIDKLDYIKDLGFTAIWISPVVKNQLRGYHGYWATDFYQTNEHFGSMEKLKELVEKAHLKGIKVIVDIVVNHTGQLSPWVGDPKYDSWFHEKDTINDYNNQYEVEHGWLANLPDLDQANPEVRKYLIDMAKWWIKETGIDGYRLDTVRHVSKDFWEEFASEIKEDYPDFYLLGEVFNGDIYYVANYQNTGIDGLADFPAYYKISDVFKNNKSAAELASLINNSLAYKNRYVMGTFIDNHDVPRFVNQLYNQSDKKLKQALAFMMTYTGIPIMYYGTEIGMDGGADPDNRKDMDWNAKSAVTDYVKKLTSIRKSNKALTYGDIKVIGSEKDFFCYSRKYEDDTVLVAFNTSNAAKNVNLNMPAEITGKKGSLINLMDSKEIKIKNGVLGMQMKPLETGIYIYKESTGFSASTMVIISILIFAAIVSIQVIVFRKRHI